MILLGITFMNIVLVYMLNRKIKALSLKMNLRLECTTELVEYLRVKINALEAPIVLDFKKNRWNVKKPKTKGRMIK